MASECLLLMAGCLSLTLGGLGSMANDEEGTLA